MLLRLALHFAIIELWQTATEETKMTNETILATISTAVARYQFTARDNGLAIEVRDGKGRLAGTVAGGVVTRKQIGSQQLMGALVRDAIVNALKAVA